MSSLTIAGGLPLRGRLRVPGDKSISHRALLLAARAEGRSEIRGLASGDDVARTAAAVRALGATVEAGPERPRRAGGTMVEGGTARLHEPEGVLDVGNSGTTIRLLSGMCAGFDWLTVLVGDDSVSRRPMDRVAEPLRAMGATIDGRDGGRLPPLVVRGGGLKGIEYTPPVASAQVKSAILLAGLAAEGETVVHEPLPTRAHTEEMLAACGADIEVSPDGGTVRVRPSRLGPVRLDVPGDPSQAAFWIVAACIVPGSDVVVEGVYLGRARAGFLDVLRRMGADVTVEGEADVRARWGPLAGTDVSPEEVPGLVDEIPVLAVAAAVASGITTFRGAGELRVKESDRIATVTDGLRALGAEVEPSAGGLVVSGVDRLRGGRASSRGDHRVAMAMAVAALAGEGESTVHGWDAVATSYPTFEEDLRSLRS